MSLTNGEAVALAARIRRSMPRGSATEEWLAEAAAQGMVARADLVDGWYLGSCRNARLAKWSTSLGKFTHLRTKFSSTYAETITHPADTRGFDVFVPTQRLFT